MRLRCALFGLWLPVSMSASGLGPEPQFVEKVQRALRNCETHNVADIFDSTSLAHINSRKVLAERAVLNLELFSDVLRNWRLVKHLREQRQPITAEATFVAMCSDGLEGSGNRIALAAMQAGPALVGEPLAWVPLLTRDGNYLGMGLTFVLEGSTWRLNWRGLAQPLSTTAANSDLFRQLSAPAPQLADFDARPKDCDMPPAPSAEPFTEAQMENLAATVDFEFDLPGPENELGRLQRAAARRYAEGFEVPSSPTAQAIFAEVLVRSLWFSNAPEPADPRWERRIDRALRLAEQSAARGADLTRFAPVARWVGDTYFYGKGGARIDFERAERAYQLGARFADEDAAGALADMQKSGLTAIVVKAPVDAAPPRWNARTVLAELSKLKSERALAVSDERGAAPVEGRYEFPEAVELEASCRW